MSDTERTREEVYRKGTRRAPDLGEWPCLERETTWQKKRSQVSRKRQERREFQGGWNEKQPHWKREHRGQERPSVTAEMRICNPASRRRRRGTSLAGTDTVSVCTEA